MARLSPEEKRKNLMSLIDDMVACAQERSAHSFQMFMDYRAQISKVLNEYSKEEQEHLDLFQKIYKQHIEISEKIFY